VQVASITGAPRFTTGSGDPDANAEERWVMTDGPIKNHATLIWSIADLLRGDYKQSEYGRVILPLVVLRRLDAVLEPTKEQVLKRLESLSGRIENVGPVLQSITGLPDVYNTSKLTMRLILGDPNQVAGNLRAWIAAFDPDTRDVIEKFDFNAQIGRLDRAKILYQVVAKVVEADLHPDRVSNVEMGYLYEELIRRFSELSNETAGEHFTPREVIRLMVDLLFIEDDEALRTPGIVRTMLDPACGTGGMLSVAQEYLRELNPGARLEAFGQELNAETYAICRSDMMLKGQKASNIRLGNSFSEDHFRGERFDYLLANPPFGVEWKKVQREVQDEHDKLGFEGRFGAGLPRINDGSFLFLQHMISKLKRPEEGGGRLAIVFNGSPLFAGGAGSGESEIRRWIIENDWLEAIVALPEQLFYNTGISTYFWIVTNRKRPERRGKLQLVDARQLFVKMRKSLGDKRNEISPTEITEIVQLYGLFKPTEKVKIVSNESLGFQRLTIERPLRNADNALVTDRKGRTQPDPALRDNASVALPGPVFAFDKDPEMRLASQTYRDAIDRYMAADVLPYAPDAWVDPTKTRIGYEVSLTRQFYRQSLPRGLEAIDADIEAVEKEIQRLLAEQKQ
jgi:type I restriction enzyme M protein